MLTVDGAGVATVNFEIQENGTPLTGLDTAFPPTGYSGSPNFKLLGMVDATYGN